ncbi:CRISPR-associated endonuclease/helicase Cas3 [Azospirillaceae bacterium]
MEGSAFSQKWAHSENSFGNKHLLVDHVRSVSRMAGEFAGSAFWRDEAEFAGLWHDLGKWGELFQNRLKGLEKGIDHWTMGACVAEKVGCRVAAMAIQGHHLGLQTWKKEIDLQPSHGLRLSSTSSLEDSVKAARAAELWPKKRPRSLSLQVMPTEKQASAMLDIRLLFSTLVDADFLDTEAHFQGDAAEVKRFRPPGPTLDATAAFNALNVYREEVRRNALADTCVAALRDELWDAALAAGGTQEETPGLWTLSAPTGAGKTLAMLGFALRRAQQCGLRRIVFVIPFLSIIEQTAQQLRRIFASGFDPDFVLEHHSLADARSRAETDDIGRRSKTDEAEEERRRRRRLAAENWDAPIIVTTNVQLLESLFSNRPAACRKLHRLRESVLLFDEAQTLPADILIPTLATLADLAAHNRSAVVFATATQPAFDDLQSKIETLGRAPWTPREIAPSILFGRVRRTCVLWPEPDAAPTSWETLALRLAAFSQALCVVNLKRQAWRLLAELRAKNGDDGVFHLSTSLIPAHRSMVLTEVRERLKAGRRCILVATQCIEAGVDVDFPVMWRAMAPLEAIAQAAGRCNREGARPLESSVVTVFEPDRATDEGIDSRQAYPTKAYAQAAAQTKTMLRRLGAEAMDIDSPGLFRRYYKELYALSGVGQANPELRSAIENLDFPKVAECYRVIDEDTVSVVVPAVGFGADPSMVLDMVSHGQKLPFDWRRKVQPFTLSMYRTAVGPLLRDGRVAPFPSLGRGEEAEWFYYCAGDDYDRICGLMPSGQANALIG